MHAHVLWEAFATSHPTQHRTLAEICVARESHLAAVLQQEEKKPQQTRRWNRHLTIYSYSEAITPLQFKELQVKGNYLDLDLTIHFKHSHVVESHWLYKQLRQCKRIWKRKRKAHLISFQWQQAFSCARDL